MESWRLLPYDIGPSAAHVARGDALVRRASQPTVWWHSAASETLILGAGQSEAGLAPPHRSVEVVRRQSGGTAVLALPGVLGLDVALPRGHRLVEADVVESYRWLGEVWVDTFRILGIAGHLVGIPEARAAPIPPRLVGEACFGSLSPYEVTVDGRKLLGLAQVRRATGVLLQSGLHLAFDAGRLAELLAPGDHELPAQLARAAVGLNEMLSTAREDDVMTAFGESLAARQGVRLELGSWTREELTPAARP